MKTTILAALAVLSLSAGVACAQGMPQGYQAHAYGSQSFTHHAANGDQAGKGG